MDKLIFKDMNNEYCADVYKIEACSIDEPWTLKQISGLVEDDKAIARVGLLDNKVICYYSFYNVCGEGYINNLAVSENYRGKGYGASLVSDMIKVAKDFNLSALTLEVNENNSSAISLYEKFGFLTEGKRFKFYNGKDDALIMWKRDL